LVKVSDESTNGIGARKAVAGNGRGAMRALVVHPHSKGHPARGLSRGDGREPSAKLAEASGLARAIHIEVADALTMPVDRPKPATYLGRGKVEDVGRRITDNQIGLVVFDADLTPVQQRNLERAWSAKVIDRTGLILEIFGERARTKEGVLQVELAHLDYQRSRLVRSWTHLERQRGGYGFMGGPGERQIETDRRIIADRMARIRHDLEVVARTRRIHRRRREKAGLPVIALVGYTNAGKSTLFNRLTRSDVREANMLFATLDPTMRALELPGGRRAVLSDTVGFISDLPTHLIAAFRATLEEVLAADVIVHVRDGAHPDNEAQAADVYSVLADLGLEPGDADAPPVLEVLNKIDAMGEGAREALARRALGESGPLPVSAVTGAGLDLLAERLAALLSTDHTVVELDLDPSEGARLSWLHSNGEVIEQRTDADGQIHVAVRLDPVARARLSKVRAASDG